MLGKIECKRRRGVAGDEMVRQHHRPNGYESEHTLGDSEGQRGLVCCSPWGRKESDITVPEQQQQFYSVYLKSVLMPVSHCLDYCSSVLF